MAFAVLEITDGTTTVDLLNTGNGLHLNDWNRAVIQPKGGGTFQSSSLAPSRRLVNAVDATGVETFDLKINGSDQDALITELQNFFRLLLKARDYWLSDWQDVPVYIRARGACETNIEYAHIVNWTVEELDNPYAQPFYSASLVAAMDDITLVAERNHWLANVPGGSSCVEADSIQEWNYQLPEDWTLRSGSPTAQVWDLLQSTTGRVFFADGNGSVRYNDADGIGVWNNSFSSAGDAFVLLQTSTGALLQGRGGVALGIYRSTSDGDLLSWVSVDATSSVRSLYQLANGRILAGDTGSNIRKSDDDGVTWAALATIGAPSGSVRDIIQVSGGDAFAVVTGGLHKSSDNGATWTVVSAEITSGVEIIRTLEGTLLIASEGVGIWRSEDDGVTWVSTTSSASDSLFQLSGENVWGLSDPILAGISGEVLISGDDGRNWQTLTSVMPGRVYSLLGLTTASRVLAGEDGDLYSAEIGTIDMGASDTTCSNIIYTSNKENIANLTHIKIDDGGAFTDIFPISSFPQALLPAVPAVNDATYFGIKTAVLNSGPFASLVFDIDTIASSNNTYTIVWEYWNGAWVALTVRDNTDAGAAGVGVFGNPGVNSVHWVQPSDWATTTIDGQLAYWVRARVSALAGTLTPPTQQNRDIYSIVQSFVDIADTAILGDIQALSRVEFQNQSDEDGRGGSEPNLWDNRVIVGLRSVDRSENDEGNFQAYLNISDEQNPVGITIALGTNTTFVSDTTVPTGRRATYNPVGVEAMADRVTVTLDSGIARDFYGEFHVFIRIRRTNGGGANTDFTIQLQISTGSGGVQLTTESQNLGTPEDILDWELLDFGQVKIPVFGTLKSSNLGDETKIIIQASAANAAIDLHFLDLVLIPVDEWAGDFVDVHNQDESVIGRVDDIARLLDIDSVTDPKNRIQSLVRQADSELISSVYNPITNGENILQANAQQRLWFLSARTSIAETPFVWVSDPWAAHSLRITHNARYLSLRGDR